MTHDEATKKAREALESVLMEYPNNRPGMDYDGPLPVFAKKCLIALAALGSLAEEPSEDAILESRKFAEEIISLYISLGISDCYKKAAALITARDERIRREAADRAVEYIATGNYGSDTGLRTAIMEDKK